MPEGGPAVPLADRRFSRRLDKERTRARGERVEENEREAVAEYRHFAKKPIAEFKRWMRDNPEKCRLVDQALGLTSIIRKGAHEYESWLCSGRFEADMYILLTNQAPKGTPEYWQACRRVAQRVSPYFADPRARGRIARERRAQDRPEIGGWILRDVLPLAVDRVLSHLHEPRQIKLGKRWARGSRVRLPPEELYEEEFLQWFLQEIKNAAEADLLSEPYPSATSESQEYSRPGPGADTTGALLHRAAGITSPRERELLRHLALGRSRRDVAALMGIRESTVRVMLHRVKSKASRL